MELNETNCSFFPPPPPRYLGFTTKNVIRAQKLKTRTPDLCLRTPFDPQSQLDRDDDELIGTETGNPLDLRTLILPPDLDWIKQNGGWVSFGAHEPWPGRSIPASLEGMPRLYDETMDRKEALQVLLNTLIHSYLELLNVLGTQGPTSMAEQIGGTRSNNTDQIVSHIELAAFNIHGLCNELRPRQARETLKLMMIEQAKEKRAKTQMILKTCADLKEKLKQLKFSSNNDNSIRLLSSITDEDNKNNQNQFSKSNFDSLDRLKEDDKILLEAFQQIV